ncbi:MAG: phosphatase PAP2 family protein [Rubricoccaceae bacterium]|nr:phosphatase PAP2 family protein [Rubricoccaceae bacterium]
MRKAQLLPVDRFLIVFNVILAVAWLTLAQSSLGAVAMAGVHVALAGLSVGFGRIETDRRGILSVVRAVYPMVLVIFYWLEMGYIYAAFHEPASHDALIIALDYGMFGFHVHETFADVLPWPLFAELMSVLYFLYYPAVFVAPLVLALMGRTRATQDIVFTLTVAYCACYLSYLFFPVLGPKTFVGITENAGTEASVYIFVDALVHAGDSLGTAFPSSHVVGTVTMALLAARWLSKPVAILFGIEALGVMTSTVYAQHHYLLDMLVGTVAAFCVFFAVAPGLRFVLTRLPRPFRAKQELNPVEAVTGEQQIERSQ